MAKICGYQWRGSVSYFHLRRSGILYLCTDDYFLKSVLFRPVICRDTPDNHSQSIVTYGKVMVYGILNVNILSLRVNNIPLLDIFYLLPYYIYGCAWAQTYAPSHIQSRMLFGDHWSWNGYLRDSMFWGVEKSIFIFQKSFLNWSKTEI